MKLKDRCKLVSSGDSNDFIRYFEIAFQLESNWENNMN